MKMSIKHQRDEMRHGDTLDKANSMITIALHLPSLRDTTAEPWLSAVAD
jgi:hypothetical protein